MTPTTGSTREDRGGLPEAPPILTGFVSVTTALAHWEHTDQTAWQAESQGHHLASAGCPQWKGHTWHCWSLWAPLAWHVRGCCPLK